MSCLAKVSAPQYKFCSGNQLTFYEVSVAYLLSLSISSRIIFALDTLALNIDMPWWIAYWYVRLRDVEETLRTSYIS